VKSAWVHVRKMLSFMVRLFYLIVLLNESRILQRICFVASCDAKQGIENDLCPLMLPSVLIATRYEIMKKSSSYFMCLSIDQAVCVAANSSFDFCAK
jgi:hypothetical protein